MIIKTKFDGLILVKNKKFNDSRGYFKELIDRKKYQGEISISCHVIF